jgi:antitoxin component of MazEF toxin-antitoxin module
VRDGSLVITPARRVRGGVDLEELVARMPKEYVPEEPDWRSQAGRELWWMAACIPRKGDFVR